MLILASGSPRRRELLTQAGYWFEVRPAEIDETVLPGEAPMAYVTRLAREKAEAIFQKSAEEGLAVSAGLTVLGADTSVVVDGVILGKPRDDEDATRMLRMLSGRTHEVITGVSVVTARRVEVAAEVTVV